MGNSSSITIGQMSSSPAGVATYHKITFIGVLLFTLYVFFRPYETIPGAGFLSGGAFLIAIATLLVFFPSQFIATGTITALPREVKAVLVLAFLAFVTIPVAKDPTMAWERFSEQFIKAVLMFVVMVNVLINWGRLWAIINVSLAVSLYLSVLALKNYLSGVANIEGYRVGVEEIGGLFGNPNEIALHLVTMAPIAFSLALGTRKIVRRVLHFLLALLFVAASMVTYSRGAFLGLIAAIAVMAWKVGRRSRVKVLLALVLFGGAFLFVAPSGYGLRVLSIFAPGLDPTGSASARSELLTRSVIVTLRNPWGIGMGNFQVVGYQNHETHNSYTQVSSEIGILGLAAYLVFILSPLRKLSSIEREMHGKHELDWRYYLSIGLQSSIASFLVSSFFGSIAYSWYVYYLVAYAVCFRLIIEKENILAAKDHQSEIEFEHLPEARSL